MAVHSPQRARRSGAHTEKSEIVENTANTATDLATLPSLSQAELKSQWTETFGTAPPKGLSRRLLIHALAYEFQTQHIGRLRPSVRENLHRMADPQSSSAVEVNRLTPGARLIREWRGTVHVVDVTEDGLMWNGRVYASLSAIARTITGTRWSGNRFFGLRKRSDTVDASNPDRKKTSSPNSGATYTNSKLRDNSSVNAPTNSEFVREYAVTDTTPNPWPEPVS